MCVWSLGCFIFFRVIRQLNFDFLIYVCFVEIKYGNISTEVANFRFQTQLQTPYFNGFISVWCHHWSWKQLMSCFLPWKIIKGLPQCPMLQAFLWWLKGSNDGVPTLHKIMCLMFKINKCKHNIQHRISFNIC